jgi:predicted nucleic acid-binding protein
VNGVLVDTSVWRAFFTGKIPAASAHSLSDLLDGDTTLFLHPAVLGELVLGGLSAKQEALMARLSPAPEIASDELLDFVRKRKLSRRGLGWVDSQLLASTLVAGAALWSLDKAMVAAAKELGAAFGVRARGH